MCVEAGGELTLIRNGVCKQLPLQPLRLDSVLLCPAGPGSQASLFCRFRHDGRVPRETGKARLDVGHDEGAERDVDVSSGQLWDLL